ncbi:MAG: CPBP family glutamic-type intramembrane protease [Armatimonadota bacterium]
MLRDDAQAPGRCAGRAISFVAWSFPPAWVATVAVRLIVGPFPEVAPGASLASVPEFWPYAALFAFVVLLPPAVAWLLARRWEVSTRRWGLRVGHAGQAVLVAPLVALAMAALATALPIAAGVGRLDLSAMGQVQRLGEAGRFEEALEEKLDRDESPHPIGTRVVSGLLTGLIFGVLLAPIVELPWRGLLQTELRWLGFARSSLLVGVLAAAWWLPVLACGPGCRPELPLLGTWLATLALLGVPLSWLRLSAGSIIPASVLAASWASLSELPLMAVRGGTELQIEVAKLAAVALVAGAALVWSPRQADAEPPRRRAESGAADCL